MRDGEVVRSVPATKQRVLLGALLVHPGQMMSSDALAEIAWDGAPPAGVRTTVRSYISRLRQAVGHSPVAPDFPTAYRVVELVALLGAL